MATGCAFLSNKDKFTVFRYGKYTIRFRAPYSLEKYTDIKEWDAGYLVVMAKYSHIEESEEEYIDLVPILENLYIQPENFLKSIKAVSYTHLSALWLIVLYLLGGYIKKYGILTRTRKRYLLTGYMVFSTVSYIGKVGLDSWACYARGETESVHYFITYLSPTVVLASIFLFLLFERIELDEILKRVIKVFAPAAFGVYLIHDNRYVRNYWIHARFSVYGKLPWKKEIFAIIGTAIAVYSLCSFIELIRADIFKKLKVREKIDVIDNILNLD